jgi:hypothetical protein
MLCNIIILFIVTWSSSAICSDALYWQDCVAAHPDCGFCCSAPVGNQCFNRSANSSSMCVEDHMITSGNHSNTSCETLCSALAIDCSACAELVWCYFCDSNNKCQSPKQHCSGGAVMQSCGSQNPSDTGDSSNESDDKWFHIVMYTSLFAAGILIVLGAVVAGLRCHRGWTQQQRFRSEARPLLSPTNRAVMTTAVISQHELVSQIVPERTIIDDSAVSPERTASDTMLTYAPAAVDAERNTSDNSSSSDALCQLCFDNDAVVAFLPCYHVHCCTECANRIRPGRVFNRYITCPFCRQKIRSMVRLTSLVQKKVS